MDEDRFAYWIHMTAAVAHTAPGDARHCIPRQQRSRSSEIPEEFRIATGPWLVFPHRLMIRNVAMALLFGLILGCAHSRTKVTQATLRGTVAFPGAMPADSILRIYLLEMVPTPASTNILALDQLNFSGGSPVAFSVRYNAAGTRPGNTYTLVAKATRQADGIVFMESKSLRVLIPGSLTNGLSLTMAPAK